MKKRKFFVRGQVTQVILVLAILAFIEPRALAQTCQEASLLESLWVEDSVFFELGFNQCQLDYFEAHIADDLRFCHDQSGFQDRELLLRNTRENICADHALHVPVLRVFMVALFSLNKEQPGVAKVQLLNGLFQGLSMPWLIRGVSRVGRMTLNIYVGQNIFLGFLFYGYG
ncbi:MAG: DUF418 domain-containing protein [Bacteroidetes bacterium]|nr:MAG: DUF418 domain-containing protein [Bacteroidota bacterium]